MPKQGDKAVSIIVAILFGIFLTIVIGLGTFIAHQGALRNVRNEGIAPVRPNPVQPFPTQPFPKPWK